MGATTTHTTADARDYNRRTRLGTALALSTTFFFDRLLRLPPVWLAYPPEERSDEGYASHRRSLWMADFYAGANGVLRARANGMGGQKKSPSANAPGLGGPPPRP